MTDNNMTEQNLLYNAIASVPTPGADARSNAAQMREGGRFTGYQHQLADACYLGKTGLMWDYNLSRMPRKSADLPVTNVSLPYLPQ